MGRVAGDGPAPRLLDGALSPYTSPMGRRGRGTERPGAFLIASTYIGTVIGAGFASGQEVLQFFTAFGARALAGLALSFLLFTVFGVRVLELGRLTGARSHKPLLEHAGGPRLGKVLDGLLTLFLLALAAAMASGAGATAAEQYGWPRLWGSGLLIALTVATVLTGIQGITRAMGFTTPALLVMVFVISGYALQAEGGLAGAFAWRGDASLGAVPLWYGAAPLYVAYNMLLAIPVLAYLGAAANDWGHIRWGAVLGGAGLAIGALAIHFAVAVKMPGAAEADIPIFSAATAVPRWVTAAYTAVLFAEIYTTAVATLFGFATRIAPPGGWGFPMVVMVGGMLAAIGGLFKFADVVGTLYPVMGGIGLVILLGLLRPPRPHR